jgi:hypothetical protein
MVTDTPANPDCPRFPSAAAATPNGAALGAASSSELDYVSARTVMCTVFAMVAICSLRRYRSSPRASSRS